MSCNRPVTAYYSNSLNGTGKRSLVFNRKLAYTGSDPTIPPVLEVACGKCLGCKADQSLMWSIRSYHEAQMHDQNCFVTLTYDEQNFPRDGKIDKRDLQLFFKKLRKNLPPKSIRYIACGEYGGQTHRPHYHAIIFGRDFLEGAITLKDDLYTNSFLSEIWGKGHVAIAPVTMGSICYVCGYVNKKLDDSDTFNLMSRRPGIGHNWLDTYGDSIAALGVVTIEGRSYQIPSRYLEWHQEELAHVKRDRVEFAREQNKVKDVDMFYKQRAREINLRGRKKSKQEKL